MPDARSGSCRSHQRCTDGGLPFRFSLDGNALAVAPIAVHVGHDHRAARPVFLHIGCCAIPHRIAARKITRIDVIRFCLIARMDRHASRQPSNPDLIVRRRLRGPNPGRRGLRFRSGRGQQKCPDKGEPNCRRLDPLHHAHPNLLSALRSPIAAPTSTGAASKTGTQITRGAGCRTDML